MKKISVWLFIAALAVAGCASQDSTGKRGLAVEDLTETGADIAVFPQVGHSFGTTLLSVAFSPDGRRIASGSGRALGGRNFWENEIKVWDVENGRELRTFTGHTGWVRSAAFSPDGQYIVSASYDATVKVWDVETGKVLRTLSGHSLGVNSAAFSPDGRYIVSASHDETVKVWDAESGKVLRTFSGHTSNVESAAFSPDGRRIVSVGDMVRMWDVETGRELRTFKHNNYSNYAAFTSDGRRIVSVSLDVKMWDVESGREIRSFHFYTSSDWFVQGYYESNWMPQISYAAFSPDGSRVVSISRDDMLKLWDTESGKVLRTLSGNTDGVRYARYTPDGRRIIFWGNVPADGWVVSMMGVWDAENGRLLCTFKPGSFQKWAPSPDGRRFLVQSASDSWHLWDAETGRDMGSLGIDPVFSPDGQRIISISGKTVTLWDAESGRELRILSGHTYGVDSAVFSSDGRRIVSVSYDTMRIWDVESGRELRTLDAWSRSNSVAFSPDGRYIALAWDNKNVTVLDAESGQLLRILRGHKSSVESVAFSPDGRHIISAGEEYYNEVKIWDTESGKLLRTFKNHINNVAFSPDGQLIIVSVYSRGVELWDAESGRKLRTLTVQGKRNFSSALFSPDGRFIISHFGDYSERVLDAETGMVLHTFSGYDNRFTASFSPDGRRIVSSGSDRTIRLWDADTYKEIVCFIGFSGSDDLLASATRGLTVETEAAASTTDGEWLAMTPEGYYQASPQGDRYLNVRVGNTVTGIDAYSDVFYNPDVVQARLRGMPDPASKASVTIQQAAEFAPPSVLIQSPDNGITVSGDGTVELSVNITDRNQPIKDIRVLVNGIRIGSGELNAITGTQGITVEEGGLTITGNQRTVNFTVPVRLVESGVNRIEVMAYNGYSWGYSGDRKAVAVTWQPPAGRQPPLPNLWVLAVGVNRYDNAGTPALKLGDYSPLGNLNFCARDARELIASFKAQEGKRYAQVQSLLIADDEARAPTAANIREGLKFLEQAGQRDVVLLFLAGHGLSDGGRFYFLPCDARIENGTTINPERAISNETLYSVLDGPGRRLIFIDACQSGGMDTARFMYSLRRSNAFMLSSSEGTSPSYEDDPHNIRWDRHGVFTYSIIRGLGGRAALTTGNNIGVTQLSGYVMNEVSELTRQQQYPQRPVKYSWGFGDFDIAITR